MNTHGRDARRSISMQQPSRASLDFPCICIAVENGAVKVTEKVDRGDQVALGK